MNISGLDVEVKSDEETHRGYVECSGGPSGLDGILVPGI